MRSSRLAAAALALIALPLAATPAAACSGSFANGEPTNLQLVERADTIVIATVVRDDALPADGRDMPPSMRMGIIIRPTMLIKGAALPGEMRIARATLAFDEYAEARSDPDDLQRAHPLSYIGGCVRYMFRQGGDVLLFLSRDQSGALAPLFEPFRRIAEDVTSPDDRWVRAVRLYVEIAALPERQRRAALIARRDALRARIGDRDALAIADDIDRQLRPRRR